MAATPGYPRKLPTVRPDKPPKSAFKRLPSMVRVQPGRIIKPPAPHPMGLGKGTKPARTLPPKKPAPIDPGLAQLNATEQRHIKQATLARNWLASTLGGINNTQAQQNAMTAGILSAGANSIAQAGQATSPFIQGSSPGGFVQGMQAAPGLGAAAANASIAPPSITNNLAAAAGTDVSAALIANAAKYATDLPSVYADKRNKYMAEMAEFKEKIRQFNVEQTNKQLADQAKLDRDRTLEEGRNNRALLAEEGRNLRASQKPNDPMKVLSPTGIPRKDYIKSQSTFLADAQKALSRKTKPKNEWSGDTPEYDEPATDQARIKQLFDIAIAKRLTPGDALRALDSAGAYLDPYTAYKWILPLVGAARAVTVIKNLSGVDVTLRNKRKKGVSPRFTHPG